MSRRHISFDCQGETLVGTIDDAESKVGLLIVSGGNETRAGAFSGMAELAARIAEAGYPVIRFDRRGVGDSTGENGGFIGSADDILIAAQKVEELVGLRRTIAFGNCDAASALLMHCPASFDCLVLANPWTFDEEQSEEMSSDAIRSRYAAKLRNPREIWRLLTGGVSIKKLAKGLVGATQSTPPRSDLATQMAKGFEHYEGQAKVLIAEKDRTGQAFRSAFPDTPVEICENAGHSFAEAHARDWLFEQILSVLHEQARQLDMG